MIFIVAPGLTVKNRLQVLVPGPNDLLPGIRCHPVRLEDKLRQGKVLIPQFGTPSTGTPRKELPKGRLSINAAL